VIPFLQLTPGIDHEVVTEAIRRVVERGWFVLGPEVEAFERDFAWACGARHAVGVGNGTDALAIALRAAGITPGDEVITSPLTAAYTALAIMMAGARPVFADIDPERLTIDPSAIAATVRRSSASPNGTDWRSSRIVVRRTSRRAAGARSAVGVRLPRIASIPRRTSVRLAMVER
jgi:dTDP-4-amino-4,6-dideoxygalactose transaminase